MLLKNAPSDVVRAAYDVCYDAVVRIVLQSDDHSELHNATECLASFISGGRQEILAWGVHSGFAMRSLLDAASRLLNPDLESSGSLFTHAISSNTGLKSSLLLIFARLIHLSAPNIEQFTNLLISIPAEGDENAFSYVMSEWTKLQREIQGSYQIKVTTRALALLFSTKHAEITKVNVQGHLIKSDSGITTRSKAKLDPDQWTLVPLPAKILALLADELIEIQEQVQAAEDEDSDREQIEEDTESDRVLF
ncbi:hypothetical protein SLA2020_090390 [Shorea laevis]